ncbi:MAG: alcohol dehydrogenase [Cytophagaceae bacterium SCN 52-12]|nr:MAG: alcohol dehydrogenase [Cytophagaceae bacterium SCN 52-12]
MNRIQIIYPKKVVFGDDSLGQFVDDYLRLFHKRLYVVTIPPVRARVEDALRPLAAAGVEVCINTDILGEPTFGDFEKLVGEANAFDADSVAGIGGGSAMDTAKLVAVQLRSEQTLDDILENGFHRKRAAYLACLPTTAGTGSEVSPNAIFVNNEGNKVGVISPELVPDAAYVDPELTKDVPPAVTAATGIDALAHCLEAYTNKYAHPVTDLVALEGIRLIGQFLYRACVDGTDEEARSAVALGSMYGGMCLGPVNTAGVHALAYPLSKEFHLPHGLSVALLLPYVMEYNLVEAPERYAAVALALGSRETGSALSVARSGAALVSSLIKSCGLPGNLAEANVPLEAVGKLADQAMQVQRLLKNNPRNINRDDAESIYTSAFGEI